MVLEKIIKTIVGEVLLHMVPCIVVNLLLSLSSLFVCLGIQFQILPNNVTKT